MIGLETARQTLKRTTQCFLRSALLPLSRRYKADRMYRAPRLQGELYTDTVEGRCISKDGNRYGQMFANEAYFSTQWTRRARLGTRSILFVASTVPPRKCVSAVAKNKQARTPNSNNKFRSTTSNNICLNQTYTIRVHPKVLLGRFARNGKGLCSRRTYQKYFGIVVYDGCARRCQEPIQGHKGSTAEYP
jgi:hypothetical protein